MGRINFEKFFKTEKQKHFDTDFIKDAESYESWDEIDFSGEEVYGEQTFEIKAEDMKYYAEAALDDNILMTDEEYAKISPHGALIAHPIFATQIAFWCIGTKGRGNWIRTPGARNPGQEFEFYEPFQVGEIIHIKIHPHDRYLKRGKCFLQYKIDFYNQNNVKKACWILALILPKTKSDIKKFVEGIRGLEV